MIIHDPRNNPYSSGQAVNRRTLYVNMTLPANTDGESGDMN
jgi:hypothetical protein